MARSVSGWVGFSALAVTVVGLVGAAGTYLIPVPYERLAAREATLDELAAAPDPEAARAALADRLDDSAAVLAEGGTTADAVARARMQVRRQLADEARAIASRLRIMVLVTTLAAVVFVGAMLRAAVGPG